MGDTESQTSRVFISYSHRDKKWLDRLSVHLAPLLQKGVVNVWSDNEIQPGQEWQTEIETAMASAHVAVLLVTPDFLASKFITDNELPPLLQSARERGLTILWIAVSASLYEEARFANFQAANNPSQPLSLLSKPKREAEFVRIARKIKEVSEGNSVPRIKKKATSS